MFKTHNLRCGHSKKGFLHIGSRQLSAPITFLFGRNGAGKTTFLRVLSGVLSPTEGGLESTDAPLFLSAQNSIQFGMCGNDVKDLLSIETSPWYSSEIFGALEVDRLLDIPLENLSSGEVQRVRLACSFSHKTSTLILDEPLSHLDWSYGFELQKIIQGMIKKGRTFVVSSHDFNWALAFEEAEAIVIDMGEVIFQGPCKTAFLKSEVQRAFNFKSVLTDNPLNATQLLALAAYERKTEDSKN